MRRFMFVALVVSVLAGCNTMYKGQFQKIEVLTPKLKNVNCFLNSEHNKYILQAPGTVMVDRSKDPLTLTCQKVGYMTYEKVIYSTIRMRHSQLNLFNGIVPSTVYDVASNSIYDFPERIIVNMVPDNSRVQLEPREINVMQKKEEELPVEPAPEEKKEVEKTFSKALKK